MKQTNLILLIIIIVIIIIIIKVSNQNRRNHISKSSRKVTSGHKKILTNSCNNCPGAPTFNSLILDIDGENRTISRDILYQPWDEQTCAIVIDGKNITLDFDGNFLRQNNTKDLTIGICVLAGSENITIKNGTVEGFSYSNINIEGDNYNVKLINMNFNGGGYGSYSDVDNYPYIHRSGMALGASKSLGAPVPGEVYYGPISKIRCVDCSFDRNHRRGVYQGSGVDVEYYRCTFNGIIPGQDIYGFYNALGVDFEDFPPVYFDNIETLTGSTTVTVTEFGHTRFTGDFVRISAIAVETDNQFYNGIPTREINTREPHFITVIDANTFTFDVTTPATATGTTGFFTLSFLAPDNNVGIKGLRFKKCQFNDVDIKNTTPGATAMYTVGIYAQGNYNCTDWLIEDCEFMNNTSLNNNSLPGILSIVFSMQISNGIRQLDLGMRNVIIRNNIITNNTSYNIAGSIIANGTSGLDISDNQITNNAVLTSDTTLNPNIFDTSFYQCIEMVSVTNVSVRGNLMKDIRILIDDPQQAAVYIGVRADNHLNALIEKCIFQNNFTNAVGVIPNFLASGSVDVLTDMQPFSVYADNVAIRDNIFAGINGKEPSPTATIASIFQSIATIQPWVVPPEPFHIGTNIQRNKINGGVNGIITQGGKGNIIEENEINGCTGDGIFSGGTDIIFGIYYPDNYSVITKNTITNCRGVAILEDNPNDSTNTVTENKANNCALGTSGTGFDVFYPAPVQAIVATPDNVPLDTKYQNVHINQGVIVTGTKKHRVRAPIYEPDLYELKKNVIDKFIGLNKTYPDLRAKLEEAINY